MPPARLAFALAAVLLLPGCGFIKFGRTPERATATGDAAMATAYSNLSTEHKILKQELVLARREGDALRASLDRAGSASPGSDLVAQLNATTRELATLRATHARLQAESPGPGGRAGTNPQLAEIEEKLATSLRNFTQLQEENTRLRADVQQARSENAALAGQLKTVVSREEQAQVALAQLNTELLAQMDARTRAEQGTAAARAQLSAVMAAGGSPVTSSAEAAAVGTLSLAKAPPASASPTAELRTDVERLRVAASASTAPPGAHRTHIVAAGDTLERLAQKYYGAPERWRQIYEDNVKELGNGRPLFIGMQLNIPD